MSDYPDTAHFPSKRDAWIVAVVWFAIAAMVFGLFAVGTSAVSLAGRIGVGILFLGSAGLCLWILHGTGYTLTDRELIIRSGPLTSRIDLDSLTEVTPSRNPLSSPALSLDRMRLRTRRNRFGVLISPVHKHAFIDQLLERCPHLERVGELRLRQRRD